MRWLQLFLVTAAIGAGGAPAHAGARVAPIALTSEQQLPSGQQLLVLCYHDVVVRREGGADPLTVDVATLAAHLNWLRSEGYRAIDLDTLVAAYDGGARLPERAVLLTFDDGYLSLYTQVFPLLRAFRMPALAAVVGQWIEGTDGTTSASQEHPARPQLITWEQALEMQSSGLVEFASHSWDLHRGVVGNPGGSLEPAATTHAWQTGSGYESDSAWQLRIRSDLERNSTLFSQRLGHRPRAIVWPYGRYNARTEAIARDLGMPVGFSLDSGQDGRASSISRIRRVLIDGNPSLARFARLVRKPEQAPTVRFIQVELDQLAAAGGVPLDRRLDRLMATIRELGVETVVLTVFEQPAPAGRIEAVYFPNRRLPVRADLLNRVAWTIATRTQARVFAWLPSDGFALDPAMNSADALQAVDDLFEDLGRFAYLQGLVVAPYAADRATQGKPAAAGPTAVERAAALAQRTRAWQPQLRTAWRLDASAPALSPASIEAALGQHDYLFAIVAPEASRTEGDLFSALRSVAGAPARTLLALPAPAADAAKTGERLEELQRAGFPNLGVIGADLDGSDPNFAALRRALSLRSRPAGLGPGGGG